MLLEHCPRFQHAAAPSRRFEARQLAYQGFFTRRSRGTELLTEELAVTAKYTAATAQIIATLAAAGTGWDAIAHELNDRGERTPTGRGACTRTGRSAH